MNIDDFETRAEQEPHIEYFPRTFALNDKPLATKVFGRRMPKGALLSVYFIVAICSLASSTRGQAAAGWTDGASGVTNLGTATYDIPIWVPPGPRGLQPGLSLHYDSSLPNGQLGVGWALQGLSVIERCGQKYAQDAASTPVALSLTDRFCIDGQRLQVTSGLSTYGAANSTYGKEIDDQTLVLASSTSTGSGPTSFVAKTKSGLVLEYGATADSRVIPGTSTSVLRWMLDSISDRNGNKVVITYIQSNGIATPNSISWAPIAQGSTTYQNTVNFGYGAKTTVDSVSVSVAGQTTLDSSRLNKISVSSNASGVSAVVRRYDLGYDTSPTTSRSRLVSVTECVVVSGVDDCLTPTTITYQNGSAGVVSTVGSATSGTLPMIGDFNGDGRDDILYYSAGTWYVEFAGTTPGTYGAPVSTGATGTGTLLTLMANFKPADIFGTGVLGLMANKSGTWRYYWWNPSTNAFVSASTGLTVAATGAIRMADVNGDGRDDIVSVDSLGTVWRRLSTSANGAPSFSTATSGYAVNAASYNGYGPPPLNGATITGYSLAVIPNMSGQRHWDLNGDGLDDVLVDRTYSNGLVDHVTVLSTPTSFVTGRTYSDGTQPAEVIHFNSDKCGDVLGADLSVNLTACDGHTANTIQLSLPYPVIGTMDWDGDGRDDILVNVNGSIGVYPSLGTQVGALIQTGIAYSGTTAVALDQDGDGLQDLGTFGAGVFNVRLHAVAAQPPDLASSFANGAGQGCQPIYISTANGGYAKGQGTQYPQKDQTDVIVVQKLTCTDGTGQQYSYTYNYSGARTDVTGRGLLGFETRTETDSRTGTKRTGTYRQDYPYAGLLSRDQLYQSNGTTLILDRQTNWTDVVLDAVSGEARFLPYVSARSESRYEVGGVRNGALVATYSESNSVDNFGNLLTSSSTVTDSDTSSPFVGQQLTTSIANTMVAPDTGNWCVGLPAQTTVTKSGLNPTLANIVRTVNYSKDSDGTKCRQQSRTIEPTRAPYTVVETFAYDGFGNLSSDSVAATGLPTRLTTIDWGTTGQFPMKIRDPVSNALGASGYKEIRGYDLSKGLLISTVIKDTGESVLNSPGTSWVYDSFGRQTRQTNADGTYVTTDYTACGSANSYCGSGLVTTDLKVQSYVKDFSTSGALINQRFMSMDGFGRLRYEQGMDISGNWVTVQTQYDNRGNVAQQSMPYVGTPYFTTYQYDILNRKWQESRPQSASVSTPQTTTWTYLGSEVDTTDALNHTTKSWHRVDGLASRSQDAGGYTITFYYDAFGSLTSVVDSASNSLFSASYDYGVGAFQRNVSDIDRGSRSINVDALGETTSYQDANGVIAGTSVTYGIYDGLGRPSTRIEPATNGTASLTTTWTWGNAPSAHNVGRLAGISSATGGSPSVAYSESYTFDALGRVVNQSVTPGPMSVQAFDIAYDASTGLVSTLTYPTSTSNCRVKLQYGYSSSNGELKTISDASNASQCGASGTVYWTANASSPFGALTLETLGNGVVRSRTFDSVTGNLGANQAGVGGGTSLLNQAYLYDLVGNVSQRQDNNRGLTENACYDALNRLVKTTASGGCSGPATLSVSYDSIGMGNISAKSDVAAGATWTYDPTHKHEVRTAGAGTSFTYDSNGNMTSRNGSAITWTSYNMPSLINAPGESATFDYGPNHQYWRQNYSGPAGLETTYYLNKLVEKVDTAAGSDWRHYIYSPIGMVAIYSRQSGGTNTVRYILEDHQSSVTSILTPSGINYVSESFSPFGSPRDPSTWSGTRTASDTALVNGVTRRAYTAHSAIGGMNLIHMNGRVQDSYLGKFLSADSFVQSPTDPQSFNRYAYVRNSPITLIDPSGLFATWKLECPKCETVPVIGTIPAPPDTVDNSIYRELVEAEAAFASVVANSTLEEVVVSAKKANELDSIETVNVTATLMPDCYDVAGGVALFQPVLRAAENAFQEYPFRPIFLFWPFSAGRGMAIHSYFASEIRGLGPMYSAEVSYLRGVPVPYGTKGSVRADALVGSINAPMYAVELKSGLSWPKSAETAAYMANLPPGTAVCAIGEGIVR